MKLVSYIHKDRPTFGAVIGDRLFDLKSGLGHRADSLVRFIEKDLLGEARKLIDGASADVPITEVTFLPPLPRPVLMEPAPAVTAGPLGSLTTPSAMPSSSFGPPSSTISWMHSAFGRSISKSTAVVSKV